jgi:hypothetical protein
MKHQYTLGIEIEIVFAGIKEEDLAITVLQHDGGIGLRAQFVLRRKVSQHQATEATFE